MTEAAPTLVITTAFLGTLLDRQFSHADHVRFLRALRLLEENERHPSLRVHELQGDLAGVWSASASEALRITFRRLPGGRKLLIACSRHYHR